MLVLREITERTEVVEAGTVRLVGTERARILAETIRLLEDRIAFETMARAVNLYGGRYTAERIVNALLGEHGG